MTSDAAPREHLRLALERRRVELLRLLLADDHLEAAFLAQLADVQTALHALAEAVDDRLRDAPEMGLSMGKVRGISAQLRLSAALDPVHGG